MRYIRYAFLAAIAIVLIVVALANREMVTLNLLPADMAGYVGQNFSYQLPQFVIIFLAIVVGLLIGFVWEWMREHKIRVEGRRANRDKVRLEREVKGLKRKTNEGQDDVLALLDDATSKA
jgi:putative membrane protein